MEYVNSSNLNMKTSKAIYRSFSITGNYGRRSFSKYGKHSNRNYSAILATLLFAG
jgi:hypothetical protein